MAADAALRASRPRPRRGVAQARPQCEDRQPDSRRRPGGHGGHAGRRVPEATGEPNGGQGRRRRSGGGAGGAAAGAAGAGAGSAAAQGAAARGWGQGPAARAPQVTIPAASGTVLAFAQQLSATRSRSVDQARAQRRSGRLGRRHLAGGGLQSRGGQRGDRARARPAIRNSPTTMASAVHVINGASGKPTSTVPPGNGGQSQAAWSMDGTHLIYSQGGQLWLLDTTHPTTPPLDLTGANAADFDPSLAPTASAHIVCVHQRPQRHATVLCHDRSQHSQPRLHPPPRLHARAARWSGHRMGRRSSCSARRRATADQFGLIEFSSNVPFSTHAADWGQGQVVTPMTRRGRG